MLRDLKFYNFLFILAITCFSCAKDDYESQIPSYISINDITLTTNYATEGSASEKITDAFEIGSGKVLTGLIKRISSNINSQSINEPHDIDNIN